MKMKRLDNYTTILTTMRGLLLFNKETIKSPLLDDLSLALTILGEKKATLSTKEKKPFSRKTLLASSQTTPSQLNDYATYGQGRLTMYISLWGISQKDKFIELDQQIAFPFAVATPPFADWIHTHIKQWLETLTTLSTLKETAHFQDHYTLNAAIRLSIQATLSQADQVLKTLPPQPQAAPNKQPLSSKVKNQVSPEQIAQVKEVLALWSFKYTGLEFSPEKPETGLEALLILPETSAKACESRTITLCALKLAHGLTSLSSSSSAQTADKQFMLSLKMLFSTLQAKSHHQKELLAAAKETTKNFLANPSPSLLKDPFFQKIQYPSRTKLMYHWHVTKQKNKQEFSQEYKGAVLKATEKTIVKVNFYTAILGLCQNPLYQSCMKKAWISELQLLNEKKEALYSDGGDLETWAQNQLDRRQKFAKMLLQNPMTPLPLKLTLSGILSGQKKDFPH
jgi:hypothetical protein